MVYKEKRNDFNTESAMIISTMVLVHLYVFQGQSLLEVQHALSNVHVQVIHIHVQLVHNTFMYIYNALPEECFQVFR